MLQFESPSYPHTLAQWLYVAVAAFLASGTTWLGLWTRRKHGPAEVRKIDAEVRSITIRDDIALGDSVTRLIKEVAQATVDAEQRRMDWLQREEELRTQIRFWRNKAEELDGRLIDACDSNVQLNARLKVKRAGLEKAAALIHYHSISFSEADLPQVKQLIDVLRAHVKMEESEG